MRRSFGWLNTLRYTISPSPRSSSSFVQTVFFSSSQPFQDFNELLDGRQMINQFPDEKHLTCKDLLSEAQYSCYGLLADDYLPRTYNLESQIQEFLGYYYKEKEKNPDSTRKLFSPLLYSLDFLPLFFSQLFNFTSCLHQQTLGSRKRNRSLHFTQLDSSSSFNRNRSSNRLTLPFFSCSLPRTKVRFTLSSGCQILYTYTEIVHL